MTKKIERDDVSCFQDYEVHIPTRTLYMGSRMIDDEEAGVDAIMAERIIKGLHLLDTADKDAREGNNPITIIMNNSGGDWHHGMAIYNAIKSCKNHITIKVFGYAMSMGSIILQAADERLMAEDACCMIHYGELKIHDHPKIVMNWTDYEKKVTHPRMEEIYMEKIKEKKPKFRKDKLRKMLDFDTILTAKQTVDLGLAHRIVTFFS